MHALCVWYITRSAKHIREHGCINIWLLFCHYYNIISMFDPMSCFLNFLYPYFFLTKYTVVIYVYTFIILTHTYIYKLKAARDPSFFHFFFTVYGLLYCYDVFVCFSWLISSVMRSASCSSAHHLPPSATSRPPSTKTSLPTPQKVHGSVPNSSLLQRCAVL